MTPLDRPARVLLVEDSPGDAQLMRIAFTEVHPDAELDVALDGKAGLDPIVAGRDGRPDLVMLDLNLPLLDGHQLLAALRESARAEVRRTPIVMVSTSRAPEDVRRSYELGARSHITKPLDVEDLYATVQSLARYWFETVELATAD